MEGGWARSAPTQGWRTTGAGFFRRGENAPVLCSSGAWILIPSQLLTCCVTLSKSLNLPKTVTSSVKW